MKRHNWEVIKDKTRWRVLEKCTHCNAKRWWVEYLTRAGEKKRIALVSEWFDGWSAYPSECTGPRIALPISPRQEGE